MKIRAALLMIALLLTLCGRVLAEADLYVLDTGGSAVLADADGKILIPAGIYADIRPLRTGGCYAARPVGENRVALLGPDGEARTAFVYDSLTGDGENIIFTRDGLCGVISADGVVLLEPRWEKLVSMGGGKYLALRSNPLDDTPDLVCAVSGDGETATGIRVVYGPFESGEGLSAAVAVSGRFGYLDADGEWAIEPAFLWAGTFSHGCAPVTTEEGMGVIDRNGRWLIEPVRGRLTLNRDGSEALVVFDGGGAALISTETGLETARVEEAADAWLADGWLCAQTAGGGFQLTDGEETAYETDGTVTALAVSGGLVIERRAFSEEQACALVSLDSGEVIGRWQELAFAGRWGGAVYCLFATYETTAVEAGGLVFYDEAVGTRRYGLIDETGAVIADGFLSLRQTGRALLTAETEDWVGLIRPDGTVIMRLDKAE